MKLYDVPRNTWIKVLDDTRTPVASPEIKKGDKIFFRHVDGMYSLCTLTDSEIPNYAEAVHLVAWAEVEVL